MTACREESIVANGLAHHVLRWGEGPTDVVLCHGFLDVGWSFDALARVLAGKGYGVAAFDWRGHGESEWIGAGGYYHFPDYVLDLEYLLPQLSDRPIHLVGHSMGGGICAMYASARPDKLQTLTLIEGIGPPDAGERNAVERLKVWLDGVHKRREDTPRSMKDTSEALKRMRIQNPELTDELGLFLASKSTKSAPDGGLTWSFDPLHRTWSPRPFNAEQFSMVLAAIETPTLVVAGERGYRLPDQAERLAHLQSYELAEISDVGHMVHWFQPDELGAALVSFFGTHSA